MRISDLSSDVASAALLLRIRDYSAASRHDLSRRSWLDCTEDPAGFIKVFPGPFAGETVRKLARFYMTADRLEAERAYRFRLAVEAGAAPDRSDGHPPELQSPMRHSSACLCFNTENYNHTCSPVNPSH